MVIMNSIGKRSRGHGPVLGKPVFGCIDPSEISNEEKRRALEAVNLIKKKRCGKIKGRTCADGSKQKRFLKLESRFLHRQYR